MRVQVFVRLKPGVLDVQGKAVEKGLQDIGFPDVSNLRVGRLVEFDVEETDSEKAKLKVRAMCDKLLANTVIENFEIRPL
ncbi:MAG: phosphoribosylformylglycinamidine synthase subunit PurS [bacterium]|nr:phosphoribosylformylglycinamidine synthase subunit PurS [bacterium]